jgi:hypothetical protein
MIGTCVMHLHFKYLLLSLLISNSIIELLWHKFGAYLLTSCICTALWRMKLASAWRYSIYFAVSTDFVSEH